MRCVKRNAKNSKRVIIKKFRSLFAVGFIMIAGVFVVVPFLPRTREQFNAGAGDIETSRCKMRNV